MLPFGTLIWISLRPLLRLALCVSSGIIITKLDIFPSIAARGASQVILNITLPCLLFSKIVPAFTSDNIRAFGPLVLVAVLYEVIGIVMAWIIKQFFWVPHRFRYGFLVAGGWGNVGDIPTSVILSVTGASPFHAATDQNLSVAYISVFVLVFMVSLFPLGGHRWIAMDYTGPDVEPEEVREALRIKRLAVVSMWRRRRPPVQHTSDKQEEEYHSPIEKSGAFPEATRVTSQTTPWSTQDNQSNDDDSNTIIVPVDGFVSSTYSSPSAELDMASRFNAQSQITTIYDNPPPIHLLPTVTNSENILPLAKGTPPAPTSTSPQSSLFRPLRPLRPFLLKVREFLKVLCSPASLAIFISFPIALVPKLKALFIEVPGTYMPSAPDGQPPLAFIMDVATFIGAASIPLGLVCLGSALARLKIPQNQWRSLPFGAITWLAIGKLLVLPILGVLICQGLVKAGVISESDKVLRFVCIFCSCLPTATTQVFLTQVYSGTGSAEHLSAFLIPQYILMFFSMTALTAYTIQLIF